MAQEEHVMKIINIIKSLFKIKTNDREKQEDRNIIVEPDFIDYDGMGNQGRFPVINKRKK